LSAPVGVLGGTFDPVHHGHLRLALEVRESLELAEVRFVPNSSPPHREPPKAPAERRADWIRRAISDVPGLVLDDSELRREGTSYMVDTLRTLGRSRPGTPLCLILGMDAFAGFLQWREPDEILRLAHIVLVERPGMQVALGIALSNLLAERSTGDASRLHAVPAGLIHLCAVTPLEIASSQIRTRAGARRSIRYLLPDFIAGEIEREGLYQR
jgi:nicotinate-nucleotide adenylyltransferase